MEDNDAGESSLLNTQAKGGWFDVASNSNNSAPSSQESLSSYTFATAKDLPTLQGKDEDGDTFTYTRMYYIDAYADEYSAPGKIHLFGKVWMEDKKRFVSACVEVSGLQRQLFFLPKAADGESEPDMGALYNEISEFCQIKSFHEEHKEKNLSASLSCASMRLSTTVSHEKRTALST